MKKNSMKLYFGVIAVFVFVTSLLNAQVLFQPYNLDFEEVTPNEMPVGWDIPGLSEKKGYSARVSDMKAFKGNYCGEIYKAEIDEDTLTEESLHDLFGSLMQSVDAAPYKGKKIRIRAAIRAEISSSEGSAHLWAHEYLVNGQSGWLETMDDQPIISNEWKYYELISSIDQYALKINFGLLLKGTGTAWIDDVSIEIISSTDYEFEPPKPLSERNLENLRALSKLIGYVKFYYAGDEARDNDWSSFSHYAIKKAIDSKDDNELISNLKDIFAPIAPAISIYKNGDKISENKNIRPKNAQENYALSMMHSGVAPANNNDYFYTKRHNIYDPLRFRDAQVYQSFGVTNVRNMKLKFSAMIKAENLSLNGFAQLAYKIDLDGTSNKIQKKSDFKVTSSKWKRYTMTIDIPENANVFTMGLVLVGDGTAYFDDIQATMVQADGTEGNVMLNNYGFEYPLYQGSNSWKVPNSVFKAGYIVDKSKEASKGNYSLMVSSDIASRIKTPNLSDFLDTSISNNIRIRFPYFIYADNETTLPKPSKKSDYPSLDFNPEDRISRLAIVIDAWNYIAHFNVNDIDQNTLDLHLIMALRDAAVDENADDFTVTLKQMAHILVNGQTRIWNSNDNITHTLPLTWEWLESGLFVTKVLPNIGIPQGAKILTYNGIPIDDKFMQLASEICSSNEGFTRLRAAVELRSGKPDDKVNLTYEYNGETKSITLNKDTKLTEFNDIRPQSISEISPGIVYIDMNRVNDKEFNSIKKQLQSAKGIIFDARGFSLMAEFFLGFFIEEPKNGVSWEIPVYSGPEERLKTSKKISSVIEPLEPKLPKNSVMLIDERNQSYAEMIALIAKENKIMKLIGRPSAGAIGEYYPLRFPAGYNLSMVVMEAFSPTGEPVKNNNVTPDIFVPKQLNNLTEGKDNILETAVKYLVENSEK